MTRDDIIRMASEAGISKQDADQKMWWLERFAQLVRNDYSNKHAQLWLKRIDEAVKAEREACAKECEGVEGKPEYLSVAKLCAASIRARGQQ